MIYYTTNCLSRNGCIAIYSFESGCGYIFGDENGSCSPFVCPKSKGLALSDKLSNCAPRVRPHNDVPFSDQRGYTPLFTSQRDWSPLCPECMEVLSSAAFSEAVV